MLLSIYAERFCNLFSTKENTGLSCCQKNPMFEQIGEKKEK
jgi:hypothetical protein